MDIFKNNQIIILIIFDKNSVASFVALKLKMRGSIEECVADVATMESSR